MFQVLNQDDKASVLESMMIDSAVTLSREGGISEEENPIIFAQDQSLMIQSEDLREEVSDEKDNESLYMFDPKLSDSLGERGSSKVNDKG